MSTSIQIHSKEFAVFLDKIQCSARNYQLPGNPDTDVYCLPCSGGADSTALAILMHILFPHIDFQLVFTDTKAEPQETYDSLDRLESYLGKSVKRVVPEMGLFELIDHYNGYLPSGSARWCTRELKLTGFKKWVKQFAGKKKWMFVGIRADEADRLAFTLDETETEMPFIDMGIMREHVFHILNMTIGIPRFYQFRTRSGCSTCFFQRRSELVGLYQYQKNEFDRGKTVEKLTAADIALHQEAIPLWKDSGIACNWQSLPLPLREGDMEGKRPQVRSMDLFGNRGIFVGGEFFFDAMYANDEFIWHQRVISYSPTLAGIKGQINDRFRHLLATAEVFEMSPDDVRAKARFAIWYVELPEDVFNPQKPSSESYTWSSDSSYAQMEHITSWVTRALHAAYMQQVASKPIARQCVQSEWMETSLLAIKKLTEPVGHVASSHWFVPTEKVEELSDEEMVKTIACPMCSI